MSRKRRSPKPQSDSTKVIPLPRANSLNSEPPTKVQRQPLAPKMTNIQQSSSPPPGFPVPLVCKKAAMPPLPLPPQQYAEYQMWSVPQLKSPMHEYLYFLSNPHIWQQAQPLNQQQVYNICESFKYFPR